MTSRDIGRASLTPFACFLALSRVLQAVGGQQMIRRGAECQQLTNKDLNASVAQNI